MASSRGRMISASEKQYFKNEAKVAFFSQTLSIHRVNHDFQYQWSWSENF